MMRSNKELAKLMKKGLKIKNVREDKKCFIQYIRPYCHVCALGAAIVGLYQDPAVACDIVEDEMDGQSNITELRVSVASKLLDITAELAEFIDAEHLKGTPVSTIILFLEATDAFRKAEGL